MKYIQTPWKENQYGQKEKETLQVFKNGNIKCTCLSNLWNPLRDTKSKCSHIEWYFRDIDNLKERGWYKIPSSPSTGHWELFILLLTSLFKRIQ